MYACHLFQRLIAAFLFFCFCLQSCMPVAKPAYPPPSKTAVATKTNHHYTTLLLGENVLAQHQQPKSNLLIPSPSGSCLNLASSPKSFNNKLFTSASGEKIHFFQEAEGPWKAQTQDPWLGISTTSFLPVICEQQKDASALLQKLAQQASSVHKHRIHILTKDQEKYVFLGSLGLKGGTKTKRKAMGSPVHEVAATDTATKKRKPNDQVASSSVTKVLRKTPPSDDQTIASHGLNNNAYWYSIADGMRLTFAIRQTFLNYDQIAIKGGEEYSALRENHNRIFLADPYYMDNFATCLQDDISMILARWQKMPTMLLIPCLGGMHWRLVQVQIDYPQKIVKICWDDPYGENHFPPSMQSSMLNVVAQAAKKLIQKQTKDPRFSLKKSAIQQEEKKIDQQGSTNNDWDCGPIVFSNLADYIQTIGDSAVVKYSIGAYDDENHAEQLLSARQAHYLAYCQVQALAIDTNKVTSFNKDIEITTPIHTSLLSYNNPLFFNHLESSFTFLENQPIAATQEASTAYNQKGLAYMDQAMELVQGARDKCVCPTQQANLSNDIGSSLTNQVQAAGQQVQALLSASFLHDSLDNNQFTTALLSLADLTQAQGSATHTFSWYTDAAILYQHLLHSLDKKPTAVQKSTIYSKLAILKQSILEQSTRGSQEPSQPIASQAIISEITRDKQELEALRAYTKIEVARLESLLAQDEEAYITGTRLLFAEIAQKIRAFLARLFQESENELGKAPCRYSVLGLGAMALQQITPYSDIEFAILLEEPEANSNVLAAWQQYFIELSQLVHLRIINLGETVISQDKYGFSLDAFGKKGLNVALGGHTSLGSQDQAYLEKPHELIQPVSTMISYLKDAEATATPIAKLLPFILANTCYVYGDANLYTAYEQAKATVLLEEKTVQGTPLYQARAKQKLLESLVAIDYIDESLGISDRFKTRILADFTPPCKASDISRLYNLKQEIYRCSNELLCNLALYDGFLAETAWHAAEQLAQKGILARSEMVQQTPTDLLSAVSFATMLRLKTYLQHGGQKEEMAIRINMNAQEKKQSLSGLFKISTRDLETGGKLFKYYYTMLPLYMAIRELLLGEQELLCQGQSMPEPNPSLEGAIHMRLMHYKAAEHAYEDLLKLAQKAYSNVDHPYLANSLYKLGIAYQALRKPEKALEHLQQALAMYQAVYPSNHPAIAKSLHNIGNTCCSLGNNEKALAYYKRAFVMQKALYSNNHPYVANALHKLGNFYKHSGETSKALEYLHQALAMYQALHPGDNAYLANTLHNIGTAYRTLGEHHQELEHYQRALRIYQALYPTNHPAVATTLHNMGGACYKLGNSEQSLAYYKQALAKFQALYPSNHPALASMLNNIGIAYYNLKNYEKALEYLHKALIIAQTVYPGNHPFVASTLHNLGISYYNLGNKQKALEYYKKTLAMRKALFPGKHPSVATALHNIGVSYRALGEHMRAIEYLKKALKMAQALHPENHVSVVNALNTLGNTYHGLANTEKALEYYNKAFEMRKALFPGNHASVANSLHNLGLSYHALGDSKKALAYFEQALNMRQALYPGNHASVANSLHNLGAAYKSLGATGTALAYFKRALAMYNVLYTGNHLYIATALHNIGVSYRALGEDMKALEYLQQALVRFQALYPGNHADVATTLYNIGLVHRTLGKDFQATEYYTKALAMFQVLYPGNHPTVASILYKLNKAYCSLGNNVKALEYYQHALAMKNALKAAGVIPFNTP
jgi:tetratricopeptide (TPR) repeat protein